MMRAMLLPISLALVGCAAPSPFDEPPPEIWGLAAVEDHDPEPEVVEVHLKAEPTRMSYVEEGSARVWAYDDTVPGPVLHIRLGQTLRVVFTNLLPQSTTIHWHGLRIDDEMDGVPAVQDPIRPGETFTYEFTPPDAGSFWYHPHVRSNVQVERGLYGALVVHEAEPPAYDRERYFVLDDVRLAADGSLLDVTTMAHMDQMHGRHGNVLLVNGSSDPLVDEVLRDSRERWRIVNTANARLMRVDVAGADWRIVAVDGTLLPEPVIGREPVLLPVGRRLDLEVVPRERPEQVRLDVALPDGAGGYDRYPMFDGALVGDRVAPGFLGWSAPPLPELRPVQQDVEIELDGAGTMSGIDWTINGAVYGESAPILADGHTPTRIVIRELSGAMHPFHLHGQLFQIVDRDSLPIVPGLLDTVLIDGDETVELYTELDNPGVWMAHCHILEHAERGMMAELHVLE